MVVLTLTTTQSNKKNQRYFPDCDLADNLVHVHDEGEAHSLLLPAEADVELKNRDDRFLPDVLVVDDLVDDLVGGLDGQEAHGLLPAEAEPQEKHGDDRLLPDLVVVDELVGDLVGGLLLHLDG